MILLSALLLAASDYNKPDNVQPYIDSLKQKYDIQPPPPPLPAAPNPTQHKVEDYSNPKQVEPYLESLREENGIEPQKKSTDTSAKGVQPYIESLKKGKELEPQYKKTVDQAAGFGVVASDHFDVSSTDAQANPFQSVYNLDTPGKYNPSFDFFYERQLYRSHTFGSIGPIAHLGVITTSGKGIFTKTGVQNQDTIFHFYAMPISLGASYRANQLRLFVPFAQFSLMAVPYLENRTDDRPTLHGYSKAFATNVGASINLDWISRRNAWAQYENNDVIHTYLTVQYELIRTFSSVVLFNYNGLYAGLTFEF